MGPGQRAGDLPVITERRFQRHCLVCGVEFLSCWRNGKTCSENCRSFLHRWRRKGINALIAYRARRVAEIEQLDAMLGYLRNNGFERPPWDRPVCTPGMH